MRAVVQRVLSAEVRVDGEVRSAITAGLLVYLAVAQEDGDDDLEYIVDKLLGLRIFPDAEGKMNLSVVQTGGELLVVSAFTVLADARQGRRPSLSHAAGHDRADDLYRRVCARLAETGLTVRPGVFAAYMQVSSVNDGPVCVLLDSTRTI